MVQISPDSDWEKPALIQCNRLKQDIIVLQSNSHLNTRNMCLTYTMKNKSMKMNQTKSL